MAERPIEKTGGFLLLVFREGLHQGLRAFATSSASVSQSFSHLLGFCRGIGRSREAVNSRLDEFIWKRLDTFADDCREPNSVLGVEGLIMAVSPNLSIAASTLVEK